MKNELERSLTHRHIQMIAIGGAIGTGLFLGSGTAIQKAGPALILAYLIAGIICFFMMRAIGELVLSDTRLTSFIDFVREYLGDRWEFVIGWTYWLCWISLAMADLTASGIYLRYWFPFIPQWLVPLVIIITLLGFNLFSVGVYGELESWFASIKVLAIIALIVTGIFLILLRVKIGTNTVSLDNLFAHGGFFPKGWNGLLAAFPMVMFAFTGIEMVGLTSGETENPQRDLPRAINSLPIRIGLFYIGSMFVVMCIYPWNEIVTSSSPFVQVFSGIGVKMAAGVINFVVLTAALSACNSAIFSTSRTLYVLARSNKAPKAYATTSKRGVPAQSLYFSSAVLLVIVLLNYVIPKSVFQIISGVATISFIFVWIVLVVCHAKYKATLTDQQTSFPMPLYPFSSIITVLFFLGVLVLLALDPSTLLSVIFSLVWFLCLALGYSFMPRKKLSEEEL
ncbi:amino acid permease [Liquorilactobacillus satsumensis]|uniref:Amino acid permease n=1 Tax=Liquorilactobacillus satsumensis DSM 16230 = JCM 12392 TaxID=1423801 RepID=A0A0R1V1F1_9LACO|nr:amino acid permease [Liquorilactobacillus satsumensis]KRL97562.1 amino acid permease [Liquorilactobacillus satsumensis DSM 16230 = JCM 12392]MCC7666671.1 amino acid permease [Liquorilactobacillus satsumensis]MCP9327512.1 amino acid permease [Liquorilactobacillus satsumensis]MCP9357548.1 amino acid permease [Liquorilactobacillus satsumensis]MCP9372553.1 amino acid permease [Liquorilactobacillus satsumensis]